VREIGPQRRKLGDAIWLYVLLMLYTSKVDGSWWPVGDAAPISDERPAVFLDVSAATARRWRLRLTKEGLIRTELAGGAGRHFRFWLAYFPLEPHRSLQAIDLPLGGLVH
jgi:hypothetical protein